jgi:hypothetical protein
MVERKTTCLQNRGLQVRVLPPLLAKLPLIGTFRLPVGECRGELNTHFRYPEDWRSDENASVRAKYFVAVLVGAAALFAGVFVAVIRDGPSSGRGEPILSVPTPIATVTGEECRKQLKKYMPDTEIPDASSCASFIYPVSP